MGETEYSIGAGKPECLGAPRAAGQPAQEEGGRQICTGSLNTSTAGVAQQSGAQQVSKWKEESGEWKAEN